MASHSVNLLPSIVALTIEKSVNTALRGDPATRSQIATLTGKSIFLNVTSPTISLLIVLTTDGVNIRAQTKKPDPTCYDACVTAEAGALLKLATRDQSQTHSMAGSGVAVSGDVGFLNKLQDIVKQLDIDWADALLLNNHPIAGNLVNRAIETSSTKAKNAKKFITENLASVLADELAIIPTPIELNTFYTEVDVLGQKAARLEAKIQQRLSANKP